MCVGTGVIDMAFYELLDDTNKTLELLTREAASSSTAEGGSHLGCISLGSARSPPSCRAPCSTRYQSGPGGDRGGAGLRDRGTAGQWPPEDYGHSARICLPLSERCPRTSAVPGNDRPAARFTWPT